MTAGRFARSLLYFPICTVFTSRGEARRHRFQFLVSRSGTSPSCRKSHVDNLSCQRHTIVVAASHFAMTQSHFAVTQNSLETAADHAAPQPAGAKTRSPASRACREAREGEHACRHSFSRSISPMG